MKIAFYSVTLVLLICCRCDNVNLQASDVSKYPWIRPFIFEHHHFGGTHNLELGKLKFSCEYFDSYPDFLGNVDLVINGEKWTFVKTAKGLRIIEKKMEVYDGVFKLTTIRLEVDSVLSKATLKIE